MFVRNVLLHKFTFTVLCLSLAFGLSSCRSTIPQPSVSLQNLNKKTARYEMHNIGPQQGSEAQSVHFSDLNQDGNLDLLVGGHGNSSGFHIEWGDSTGNWTKQSGPNTLMQPASFAVGDLNHDNQPEVLIGGSGIQKGLQVWQFNITSRTWTLHSSPVVQGIFSSVKLSDLNNDGWLDIVAAQSEESGDGGILVLLNNGNDGWIKRSGPIRKGVFTCLSVADINHDGNPDIIASRRGGLGAVSDKSRAWAQVGGVQIWYGDGSGRWEPEVLPAPSDAEAVTIADINRDGQLDIIAGLYQQGIRAWLASPDGWKSLSVTNSDTWANVRVGDLDFDGHKELIASSNIGKGLRVWSWKNGHFVLKRHQTPDHGVYLDLELGDVQNNKQLEIAAVRNDGGVEIWSTLEAPALPVKKVKTEEIGAKLSIYFASGTAQLSQQAIKHLNEWAQSLQLGLAEVHLELQGHADQRPITSELYPNNAALSQARADSVAAWLTAHGATPENLEIGALGDSRPFAKGYDPLSLKENRRVFIQAYRVASTRTPPSTPTMDKRSDYNILENKVFKTIDGIPEYKVDKGDELSITFWQGGKPEVQKVTVQIDGTVSLPYQAALKVAGYTPREIDNLTTELLRKYERNPRVDVQVLKAKSKFASIFGEVQSLSRQPTGPGTYPLRGKETLVDFLSRAGGPTKEADLDSVQLIRGGNTMLLNLTRAIRQGDLSENAVIDDGDTIFIPSLAQSKRQVYVLGQVAKAGIVEFTGDISFLDAISKAGGLTDAAYLPDIRILRADRDQPQILAVNFQRFLEKGDLTQNLALVNKDIIIIPSRPVANWNKFIADISPSITLLLQPVSIAQQILSLRLLSGQVK